MKTRTERYEERVRTFWEMARFVTEIGIELTSVEPGRAESKLAVNERHSQQDGFVHAGVLATMADHTAGAAAATLFNDRQFPLAAEFKINFLRAAQGEQLRCVSTVLKEGRTLSVVESEIVSIAGSESVLVAKAMVTIAVVER